MAEVTINGNMLSGLGVTLLEGSYASLLTPPEMKGWVSNDDPRKDGVEYIVPATPVVKERSVNLYFLVRGATMPEFLARYNNFIGLLQRGMVVLHVPDLRSSYTLKYESCTAYDCFGKNGCKVAVKFTEPQPANRATMTATVE